jgi:plasmanylethanolamine desaturase
VRRVGFPETADRGRFRAFEVASIAAFFALVVLLAGDIASAVGRQPLLGLLVPPVALLGYLTSDFTSGLVHWLADRYGSRTTPLLGPKFVVPFRDHHDDPAAISRHDFVEANGDNCFVALFALVPASFLRVDHAPWLALLVLYVLVLAVGTLLTSMAHGWAHRDDPPKLAKWLARAGLVIAREHHQHHHQGDHLTHYCITTGWLNGVLDRAGFFRKLEQLFDWLGIPRSHDAR